MEEGEFQRFIKSWVTVLASLTYCYFISRNIPKGFFRLLSVLPIISIFTLLPLNLTSLNFSGSTGFIISWLANFKLLLFSFDQGPLSSDPSISFQLFISLACLPINIKQNPSSKSMNKSKSQSRSIITSHIKPKSSLYYATKTLLFVLSFLFYEYRKLHMYPTIILFLYCFQMYSCIELMLAMGAAMARLLLGVELEPQFDDPYLSTSLQDFWGRRWNLTVMSILRATVYVPVRCICTRICGIKVGLILGVLATFVVSGVMHELMFFYMDRKWPACWDIMWFFVLHGICLAVEIAAKKSLKGRWQLHALVSRLLTIVFVSVTGFWLFFPSFRRLGVDVRMNKEMATFAKFVLKDVLGNSWGFFNWIN